MMHDGAAAKRFSVPICPLPQGIDLQTLLGIRRSSVKLKFTAEEDARLTSLVTQYGTKDWVKISLYMQTRNPRQCRERWNNYVNPNLRTDPWTAEEDKLLEQKYEEFGARWNKISKFFTNRSDNSIRNRWMLIARRKRNSDTSPISPPPVTDPVRTSGVEQAVIGVPVAEMQPLQNAIEWLDFEEPEFTFLAEEQDWMQF